MFLKTWLQALLKRICFILSIESYDCSFFCQAYSDKSRDYTVPEGMTAPPQTAPPVWHGAQTSPAYHGSEYAAVHPPGQSPPPWDAAAQGTFISVPGTFPGQTSTTYVAPPAPPGSSLHSQASPINYGMMPPSGGSTPVAPYNRPPGGGSSPYYGR